MKLRFPWGGLSTLVLVSACSGPAEHDEPVEPAVSTLARSAATVPARPERAEIARISHRSRKDPSALLRATGRRELSAEELARHQRTVRRVAGVHPTELFVERLREANDEPGRRAPTREEISSLEAEVVPFGSDIVTTPAGDTDLRFTAAQLTLPRSVDNSTSPAFPEIRDQGSINSCVPFSIGYYQYTYALGKLLGWSNKNPNNSTKISPKWLYNLTNGGGDFGTGASLVHQILQEHGALTWSEFPYTGDVSNPLNYLAWPTSGATWKNALRYKSLGLASLGTPSDSASLAQAKRLLANGQVLTFSTFVYSWEYEQVDNDRSTQADNAFVGQSIVTWMNGFEGGHQATIVGYNDNLWVDINANGVVESGEKGAFKIANSWGPNWMNSGYVWIAYDALQPTSLVPNGPGSDLRGPLMGEILALVGARTNYQPQLLAEFTVATASRGELTLAVQQTDIDRTDGGDEYRPLPFNYSLGNYAYDGTVATQAKTASFALDLSEVALSYGDLRYRIRGDNSSSIPSRISNFSLTDRLRNNLKTVTTDPQVTIAAGESKSQSIRYKFQDPARVPSIAVAPSSSVAFGTLTLGAAAQRQLTVQNTGTGDLGVTSLRFDNPLFLVKSAGSFRLPPGASALVDLEFAPAASQSETGTLSLRNTSTNQPSPSIALSGAATSTNDSAPYQVFITQQNSPTDNSVAFRAELKSRVSTSTALSNYQVVYYLNDPELDPATLTWDTYYSTVGAIDASVKRVFLARELGPRKADLALTFRFRAGATLAPGGSVIFQGSLHRTDWSWYPNENDDWSRFLRRNGMAEGTIVQRISDLAVLFGLSAERPTGAYQLSVSPNPA
ncbi:MAG TPA: choice-of-anchor D domain-containing protein, partial [Polyangiaceae bacterium]